MTTAFRVLMLLVFSAASQFATAVPAVGEPAPAWTAPGPDGAPFAFEPGPRARPAIVLFWATWCPYCKALMPSVQRVLDDVGPGALDVYALSINEDEGADPHAEIRRRDFTFTSIAPADAVAEQYGVRGTPVLLLVGRDGRVSYARPNGARPEQVEAALRALLAPDRKVNP